MAKDYRSNSIASRPVYATSQPANRPEQPLVKARSAAITVICVILALFTGFHFFTMIRDASKLTGIAWMSSAATLALDLYATVGLWKMKKWGAYTFAISLILGLVFYLINISNAG